MIRDRNIEYQWRKEFIPWTAFGGIYKLENGTPNKLISAATAASDSPEVAVVASTNAVLMNPNGADELLCTVWVPASDIDWAQDVWFRCAYSTSVTDADAITWTLTYEKLAAPAAIPSTINDELDTVIAADTASVTGDALQFSPVGKVNGETVAGNDADTFLALQVKLDAYAGSNGEVSFHGLQIAYTPRFTVSAVNNVPPMDAANPFTSTI
jgi:hypothetical protein